MVEQGDVIKVEGIKWSCLVISKNSYQKSGHAIVCPITNQDNATLGYALSGTRSGFVQCDNLRMLDLNHRGYSVEGHIAISDLVQILSRVNALFDLI